MRKATSQELSRFMNYRANHIALVQRIGHLVFNKDFSDHDHDKVECSAEDLNTYALRNSIIDRKYEPLAKDKEEIRALIAKHVKTQKHHPEYWDESIIQANFSEGGSVNCSKMPKSSLLEMIADWAAVAIKRNAPLFQWYNLKCEGESPRFLFTQNQKNFIIENMQKVIDNLFSEKLFYPGVEYTASQIEPLKSSLEESKKALRKLEESILDIPNREYSKDLFNSKNEVKQKVRDQILDTVKTWQEQINFPFNIKKIYVKGSLLSKRYNNTTDLDVTIVTDMSKDQLDEIFDIIPKGQNIEGTDHPLDFYVLTLDEETPLRNLDNVYDIKNNKWIKQTEEYDNEIPLDYIIQVCNFFINGAQIALSNYENDRILYEYYQSLNSKSYDMGDEELKEALEDKERDLRADLDALKIAVHMISSFRHEAYDEQEPTPFKLSIEVSSDNPHLTANEQFTKVLEKFGIREALRDAIRACKDLLKEEEDSLQEEVSSGAFSAQAPENVIRIIEPADFEKDILQESEKERKAAYCFGRYNPPTIGHLRLWEVLNNVDADRAYVYASHTQDTKKNPLHYSTKSAYIKAILEENSLKNTSFVNSEAKTFLEAAVELYEQGYESLVIVAGSDRLQDLLSLLKKYNNVPNREGKTYNFSNIIGVSAGERDPDSDGIEGVSGTKMRRFVKEDSFEEFLKNSPIRDPLIVQDIFSEVKKALS